MNDIITTGLFSLASGLVTGFFTWLSARNSERVADLRDENKRLRASNVRALEEVESYHTLEGLYATERAENGAEVNVKTVKTEFRNKVEALGFRRPAMTAHEARKAISEVSGA